MHNPFKRKPKLLQIGPTIAVDPKLITAIYRKNGMLTIRFGGIGIIEIEGGELFKTIKETFELLLSKTS